MQEISIMNAFSFLLTHKVMVAAMPATQADTHLLNFKETPTFNFASVLGPVVSWLYDLSIGLRLGEGFCSFPPSTDPSWCMVGEGEVERLTWVGETALPPSKFNVSRL